MNPNNTNYLFGRHSASVTSTSGLSNSLSVPANGLGQTNRSNQTTNEMIKPQINDLFGGTSMTKPGSFLISALPPPPPPHQHQVVTSGGGSQRLVKSKLSSSHPS